MAVQLLSPAGELREDPAWPLEVTPELCRDLHRRMRLARRFDDEAVALQRQGELGLWVPLRGQEAAQVGSITALRPDDHVFPSYREHAVALARGVEPADLLAQWRGTRNSGWDPDRHRLHVYTLVLAAQLPHATGYAMGVQRDGVDEVVAVYFGDGATSEGDANEAFNWAAVTGAPVLFFCQNNQWAISTPNALQMRAPLHQRARGFGLAAHHVDGNDVLAVHAVTRAAAEQIRAGGGPVLIEAMTFRMGGHSTSDDPTRYRHPSEVDSWRARDPISRLDALLTARGWFDDEDRARLDAECAELGSAVREACLQMPSGPVDELFTAVLAEPSPLLAAERQEHRSFVASDT